MIKEISGNDDVLKRFSLSAGSPNPLGANFDGNGVNFAIFSANAHAIELCLFSEESGKELVRIPLRERSGNIWHIYIEGMLPGAHYGYRVDGEYAPEKGHRFNANKLLIDPYAKQLSGALKWSDCLMGYKVGSPKADMSFDKRDSAFAVPKSVVVDPSFSWGCVKRPDISDSERIIYEAHVKGFTKQMPNVSASQAGKYLGIASDASIDHMLKLGITTIELLPVQSFITDRFLVERGLQNYWGYQTIGFFAPDLRYMRSGQINEFQMMVSRLHSAGIEVILDVVYNHTGEGNELGPTLSFRGIDNASYYSLEADQRFYTNYTGTGNMLDLTNFNALRLVMDSLRYWVEVMGVDGFRFDLATVLAREENGFDRSGSFLDCIRQDPVLSNVKLIAEPWDIGPGGYQMGNWPRPFLEWNDRYRDDVRMFWRGDEGKTPAIASSLLGSANHFDRDNRCATASVNFISAHDGFTLADTVRYVEKHNELNLENNQDGHGANYSDNFGVEGVTDDREINSNRLKRMRNLMTTLLLSQGTPMILAGDEIGNSQAGNNNAYAQDNDTGWVNWEEADTDFLAFVQKVVHLRKNHKILRQTHFLHSQTREHDNNRDLVWRLPNGDEPTGDDWNNHTWKALCMEIRLTDAKAKYSGDQEVMFIVMNAGEGTEVKLPDQSWTCILDTNAPEMLSHNVSEQAYFSAAQSIQVFTSQVVA